MLKQKIRHKRNTNTKKHISKRQTNRKQTLFIAAFLFVFAFLLYSNTLQHDFALDDSIVITENRFVQNGIDGINDIFSWGYFYGFNSRNDQAYRPVVLTTFAVERSLFNNDPLMYHLFNVLYFSLSVIFLFLFLLKIFRNKPTLIPFLITLIYAAHPIHTEVVANIKSRDEILFFLFSVLTYSSLIDYLHKKKMKFLTISLLFFFISFLCKEHAITTLAIVPLLIYYFSDFKLSKGLITTFYFVCITGIYFILRANILDTMAFEGKIDVANNALIAADNLFDQYATNFVHLLIYLKLLFIPYPLVSDYSFNQIPITTWLDIRAILGILFYLSMGAYALMRLKKKDIFAFCILFYFITFSISSNLFIKIGATMGERFLFTPSLAFSVAIIFLIFFVLKVNLNKVTNLKKYIIYIITLIIVFAFSILTINRNKAWKNSTTLAFADIKHSPNSARMRTATGLAYRLMGEKEFDLQKKNQLIRQAIVEYQLCTEIYPGFTESYYNLGVCYGMIGDNENALKAYSKTVELKSSHAYAWNNMGSIYCNNQEYDKALSFFSKASEVDSGNLDAWNNMGVAYFNKRDYQKALEYFTKVMEVDMGYKDALANMGAVQLNIGNYSKAAEYLEQEIERNPNNLGAYKNMIKAYERLGNKERAEYYTKLLEQFKYQ